MKNKIVDGSFFPADDELYQELYRKSYYEFVKDFFPIVEPENPFIDGWHIHTLCEYLEAFVAYDIKKLLVLLPIRHAKSFLCSVFLAPWTFIDHPSRKFMYASYSESLALTHATQARAIIKSERYRYLYPEVVLDKEAEGRFETNQKGFRVASSVTGLGTGATFDHGIADDPLKADLALTSEVERTRVNTWFDSTFSVRGATKRSNIMVVAARLHSDDLVGHILSKDNASEWETLCLPARYEGIRFHSINIPFEDKREIGEPLWKERYGEKELSELEVDLGSDYNINAQLQMRPSNLTGSCFKEEHFSERLYENEDKDVWFRFQAWDTAASIKTNAAFSCCITFEMRKDCRLFVRDVFRARMDFPTLATKALELYKRWNHLLYNIYIENESSGQQLIQSLQASLPEAGDLIVGINPRVKKEARWSAAALWTQNGSVLLPVRDYNRFSWLAELESELYSIETSKFKDQGDSFSQGILEMVNLGYLQMGLESRMGMVSLESEVN